MIKHLNSGIFQQTTEYKRILDRSAPMKWIEPKCSTKYNGMELEIYLPEIKFWTEYIEIDFKISWKTSGRKDQKDKKENTFACRIQLNMQQYWVMSLAFTKFRLCDHCTFVTFSKLLFEIPYYWTELFTFQKFRIFYLTIWCHLLSQNLVLRLAKLLKY